MPESLPVLMYHGLHAGKAMRGRYDPVYSVDPSSFARQLDWMANRDYRSIGLAGLDAGEWPARSILISFDDGDASNLEMAVPMLRERGFTAVFFITSAFLGQPGMLRPDEVPALLAAGMEVGSHGASHRYLADLDAASLAAELADSRARLESLTGTAVAALALPGGRGGMREREAALAHGYRWLFGSVPGPNRSTQPGRWLQRLAIRRNLDLMDFAALVEWRGPLPRLAAARHRLLGLGKRLLGNARYERLRTHLAR
ncbi:MAG: polysaccharide deacetylase family protein [Xanthomonadales bacterium]|nr:polysaccharide deacetylase family protein [Xanthomonadales bacterium]